MQLVGWLVLPLGVRAQGEVYVDETATYTGLEQGTCAAPYRTWAAGEAAAKASGAKLMRIYLGGYEEYTFTACGQAAKTGRQGSGGPGR